MKIVDWLFSFLGGLVTPVRGIVTPTDVVIGLIFCVVVFRVIILTIKYFKQMRKYNNYYSGNSDLILKKRDDLLLSFVGAKRTPAFKKKAEAIEKDMLSVGWHVSAEFLTFIRIGLAVSLMVLMTAVTATNLVYQQKEILDDLNYKRMLTDMVSPLKESKENITREYQIYNYLKDNLPSTLDIGNYSLKDANIALIGKTLSTSGLSQRETSDLTASRMYEKLLAIYKIQTDKNGKLLIVAMGVFGYMLPNIMFSIKRSLISINKDIELLNLYCIYIAFGRIPPYDIKIVLENMVMKSKIYRDMFIKINENVKLGKPEVFTEVLDEIGNSETDDSLINLIEQLYSFYSTGLVNENEKLNDWVDLKLRKMQKDMKNKALSKFMLTSAPFVFVIMLAGCYLLYGTMNMSNSNLLTMGK